MRWPRRGWGAASTLGLASLVVVGGLAPAAVADTAGTAPPSEVAGEHTDPRLAAALGEICDPATQSGCAFTGRSWAGTGWSTGTWSQPITESSWTGGRWGTGDWK